MFERFTRNARHVVTHAVEEAESRGDTRIGTEHLLTAAGVVVYSLFLGGLFGIGARMTGAGRDFAI